MLSPVCACPVELRRHYGACLEEEVLKGWLLAVNKTMLSLRFLHRVYCVFSVPMMENCLTACRRKYGTTQRAMFLSHTDVCLCVFMCIWDAFNT